MDQCYEIACYYKPLLSKLQVERAKRTAHESVFGKESNWKYESDESDEEDEEKKAEAPMHYKKKNAGHKGDEKKADAEDEAEAAEASEEAEDAEALQNAEAEAEDAPALAAQSEAESESVVASLNQYFSNVLGGNINKEES